MDYNSEEEFLMKYDSSIYDKLSMTTDIIIFSVSDMFQDNYRKTSEKAMSILLIKRDNYPFKDKWCLPGGFLKIDEELDECPKRILKDETNLKDIYMEQLYTFGKVNRDPRMRIVSTAYMALIDKNNLKDRLSSNAEWFNIKILEKKGTIQVNLDGLKKNIVIKAKKNLIDKTNGQYNFEVVENDSLAFDHAEVLLTGIERLKNKVEYTDIVFNMMPKYFTLGELQKVYEVIIGKTYLVPAFRRIIANKVEKTNEIEKGGGHRPSYLYKYKK